MFRVYCIDSAGNRFMRTFATLEAADRLANSPSVRGAIIAEG